MRFLRVAFVIAIALSLTASVYAETQSVKVSGDLTIRGLLRDNYDLRSSAVMSPEVPAGVATGFAADGGGLQGPGTYRGANQAWWMSQAEVQVDAELTDCVSTCIRIANERDWNVQNPVGNNINQNTAVWPNGFGGWQTPDADAEQFEIELDLAYVTLKNFIYQPLTVTIGRQDLWFGKGFIVGSNQVYNNWLRNTQWLNAPEYTLQTAFDAFKAVLDYDPWTITGIYSAILTNSYGIDDGVSLWGVNVGYKFDCYNAEAEAYWFLKNDQSMYSWNGGSGNIVNTLGMRGSMDPICDLTVSGEVAFQVGKFTENHQPLAGSGGHVYSDGRDRLAWALDAGAEYRGFMEKMAWKPKIATEYILYSGDRSADNPDMATGTYGGWDPMFRGKFDSAIREFVGMYYATYDYPAQPNTILTVPDASYTNQNQLVLSGSLQPMDCLTLKGNYNMFWTYTNYRRSFSTCTRGGYIGSELDLQAIWDYTEDVSFGFLAAWFYPGSDVYDSRNINAAASDIVGTVKVSF